MQSTEKIIQISRLTGICFDAPTAVLAPLQPVGQTEHLLTDGANYELGLSEAINEPQAVCLQAVCPSGLVDLYVPNRRSRGIPAQTSAASFNPLP